MSFSLRSTASFSRSRSTKNSSSGQHSLTTLGEISSYAKNGAGYDHAKEWHYPETSDGWYRIHNAVRAEITKLNACVAKLAGAPLQEWQVKSMQAYWKGHEKTVHSHHHHEDDLFTPMLKQRTHLPEKLETDHVGLVQMMDQIGEHVKNLKVGAPLPAQLLDLVARYKTFMEAHLKEEETICVPLMRAYFEPDFVAKLVGEVMQKLDPMVMGSFVHHHRDKAGFMQFMKQEGIPFFVWYLNFKGTRTKYRKEMETHVQAILQGKPAAKPYTSKAQLSLAMNCGNYSWQVPPGTGGGAAQGGGAPGSSACC